MYKLKLPSLDNTWCNKDYLILEACFQLLVDFVEVECARMEKAFTYNPYNIGTLKYSLYSFWYYIKDSLGLVKVPPELGIKYLMRHKEEIEEINKKPKISDDDLDMIKYLIERHEYHEKVLELYRWWKEREKLHEVLEKEAELAYNQILIELSIKYQTDALVAPLRGVESALEHLTGDQCNTHSYLWQSHLNNKLIDSGKLSEQERSQLDYRRKQYVTCSEILYNIDNQMLKKLIDLRVYLVT